MDRQSQGRALPSLFAAGALATRLLAPSSSSCFSAAPSLRGPSPAAPSQLPAHLPAARSETSLHADDEAAQRALAPVALGCAAGLAAGAARGRAQVERRSRRQVAVSSTSVQAADTTTTDFRLPCTTRGVLPNGLRYVVLEHAVPAGRVEAHLEIHVGSVEENDDQRGMAHMMEHICFLGSQKRENLQGKGIGMTSNALTDFQHTVYHLSLPTEHLRDGLDVLAEVGFAAEFRPERIEKERRAVLSEAQMINDSNYRLTTQMIGAIHSENPISERFPIGLETQIARWSRDELLSFHKKWYVPENATLYVVGDAPAATVVEQLEAAFSGYSGSPGSADPWARDSRSAFRPPADGRPVMLHDFVEPSGQIGEGREAAARRDWTSGLEVSVATNEVLQGMQICWAAKAPMRLARALDDMGTWLCTRLIVEVIRLRLQSKWGTSAVPCNFHIYDTSREGVENITMTLMAEPMNWKTTLEQVVQQIRAVARHGATEQELKLALQISLDKAAGRAQSQPWAFMSTLSGFDAHATSREVVDAMIAAAPCGHLMASAEEFGDALRRAGEALAVEQLNEAAASLLGHFGTASAERGTVVVSCPGYMTDEVSRQRIEFKAPSQDEVRECLRGIEDLSREEVAESLVEVPGALLPPVDPVAPIERSVLPDGVVSLQLPNGLRVRLFVRPGSPDGPVQGTMRLTSPVGRVDEFRRGLGPGSIEAGLKTLENCGVGEWKREQLQLYQKLRSVDVEFRAGADVSEALVHFASNGESCRAGLEYMHWLLRQPQMDLKGFAEGQLRMKGASNARDKSLEGRAIQALLEGMYPNDPWIAGVTTMQVNMLSMGQARRAVEAQLGSVGQLQLDICCSASPKGAAASSGLSRPTEESESCAQAEEAVEEMRGILEREVCSTLGVLPGAPSPAAMPTPAPASAARGGELRMHVPDNKERALVLIAGGAPGYWGTGDAQWKAETSYKGFSWGSERHPLFPAKAMEVMSECMNGRFLGRVRDQLSLTYNVEMNLTMYEGFEAGHFVVSIAAFPDRLAEATQAALSVLKSPDQLPFMDREIESAKKVMSQREKRDQRERGYLVGKLRRTPDAGETGAWLEEERALVEAMTADDIQRAWGALTAIEDPFVVLATSGGARAQAAMPLGPVVSRTPRPQPSSPSAETLSAADLIMQAAGLAAPAPAPAPPPPSGGSPSGMDFLD